MRVGIIGFAGSGKDTIAKMLQEQLWEQGYCCGIERFASPLKDLARAVFGNDFDDRSVKEVLVPFTHEMKQVAYSEIKAAQMQLLSVTQEENQKFDELLDELLIKDLISPRTFQQYVGTDLFRAIKPTVWVDATQAKTKSTGIILIPDVRFGDEAAICDALILVNRPGIDAVESHVSEKLAHDFMHLKLGKCEVGDLKNTSAIGYVVKNYDHTNAYSHQEFFYVFNRYSLKRMQFILSEVVTPRLMDMWWRGVQL